MAKKQDNIFLLQTEDLQDLTISVDELKKLFAQVRNNALNEALVAVTQQLDPGGNYDREMGLVHVLKTVSNLRTDEPEDE